MNDNIHPLLAVFAIIAFALASAVTTRNILNNEWRREAAEVGHAEFYLDKDHNRQWRWKNGHDD